MAAAEPFGAGPQRRVISSPHVQQLVDTCALQWATAAVDAARTGQVRAQALVAALRARELQPDEVQRELEEAAACPDRTDVRIAWQAFCRELGRLIAQSGEVPDA